MTHGHCSNGKLSPTYVTWRNMITRCTNPRVKEWPNYGGRGIKVCARWRKFENFLEDMGERPLGRTINRVDNKADYRPGNCDWATSKQQLFNRRPYKTQKDFTKEKTMTPAKLINDFGGPSRVAELVNRSPGAVRLWKHRDYFPREAWPEIQQGLGVSLGELLKMERKRK